MLGSIGDRGGEDSVGGGGACHKGLGGGLLRCRGVGVVLLRRCGKVLGGVLRGRGVLQGKHVGRVRGRAVIQAHWRRTRGGAAADGRDETQGGQLLHLCVAMLEQSAGDTGV